jgi:hypothetical protein
MGELMDELLQPPIDFPADQRLGRLALDPARQLLQQVLAQLAILVPLASRVSRSFTNARSASSES